MKEQKENYKGKLLQESHAYDDILSLPHHVSTVHPPMPISDRAAQFSPFAALTGYDAAIKETGRRTEEKMELDEEAKAVLDAKLQILREKRTSRPEVTITYFQPDERKSGGKYLTETGVIRKIDPYKRILLLETGTQIPISSIMDVTGELFSTMEEF